MASDCDLFQALIVGLGDRDRVVVRQEPDTGVPLTGQGDVLLTLEVSYQCAWDREGQYLAVDGSAVKVSAGAVAAGEPIFRYEYVRAPGKDQPGAHLQIHAHRDGIAHVMSKAGGSARSERAAEPKVAKFHG